MRIAGALLLGMIATSASADNGTCDCSQNLGSCSVRFNREGSNLTVHGPGNRCVNVTYYSDGQPYSLTLRGSSSVEVNGSAEISVGDDCHICGEGGQQSGQIDLFPRQTRGDTCSVWREAIRIIYNDQIAACQNASTPKFREICTDVWQEGLQEVMAQPCQPSPS